MLVSVGLRMRGGQPPVAQAGVVGSYRVASRHDGATSLHKGHHQVTCGAGRRTEDAHSIRVSPQMSVTREKAGHPWAVLGVHSRDRPPAGRPGRQQNRVPPRQLPCSPRVAKSNRGCPEREMQGPPAKDASGHCRTGPARVAAWGRLCRASGPGGSWWQGVGVLFLRLSSRPEQCW